MTKTIGDKTAGVDSVDGKKTLSPPISSISPTMVISSGTGGEGVSPWLYGMCTQLFS